MTCRRGFIVLMCATMTTACQPDQADDRARRDDAEWLAVEEVPLSYGATEGVRTMESAAPGPGQRDTLVVVAEYGDSTTFGDVQAIFETPRHLVVADRRSSPHVAVMDRATKSITHWIGEHGSGSRQFSDPAGFDRVAGRDDRAWVHDFSNRRLSLLEVSTEGKAVVIGEVPLRIRQDMENVSWIGDSIVATALGNLATIVFFDEDGHPSSRVSLMEPFSNDEVPHATGRFMLNRASMAVHPQGLGIALGYYSSADIFLLDRTGVPSVAVRGRYEVDVRYRLANGRFSWSDGNQYGHTRLMATSDHIIAFYCGCTYRYPVAGARKAESKRDPSLHVYTWSGEFVGEYYFGADVLASSLAVSRDGNSIFGAVSDPYSRVVQWKFP